MVKYILSLCFVKISFLSFCRRNRSVSLPQFCTPCNLSSLYWLLHRESGYSAVGKCGCLILRGSFRADAQRLDKGCAAITEIVGTLYELDCDEPGPYLAGLKHLQMEASFGPPVDEAAKLRALSAQGLLGAHYPDAPAEVVPLLVDREPLSRIAAIRAPAVNGGEAGVLLLRVIVLTGNAETEVMGECCARLLTA